MTVMTLLKRFVALVTGLKSKYLYDPFFRTQCNVIILQGLFALSLLIFITLVFDYLYDDITETLLNGIRESITTGGSITGKEILDSTESVKTDNLSVIFIFATLITVLFGYFVSRVSLLPARNALESQKRFIGDIAHELRTPLSVIKTNSEVTLLDNSLTPHVKKTLKSNIEELDRTSEIINNLLTFSNWVQPERVRFGQVDLGLSIDASIKKLKGLIEEKRHTLTIQKKSPHTVWGNITALEQVVTNLLKNAVSYTPHGGEIFITVEPDYQGFIILTIRDTGVGITAKDLHHIFEPFYRAERSRSRQTGSSGLGLTIVGELIKLHRGKITIRSKPNRGTTVVVTFSYIKEGKPSPKPFITGVKDLIQKTNTEDQKEEISVDYLKKSS